MKGQGKPKKGDVLNPTGKGGTPKSRTKNNKDKMIKALETTLGVVTQATNLVGINAKTFYQWCKEDPEFKERVDEIDNIQGDFVESKLFEKIREGSEKMIMFYMKYKGRNKGYNYGMGMDLTTGGDKITEVKLIYINNNDEDKDDIGDETL